MKRKWVITTILFGIPAFLLSRILWHPAMAQPTAAQLPFFIFLSILEAVVFGIGMSFILFGYPYLKRFSHESFLRANLMYLAISWLLISWWPHDNFHMANGMNLQGLLYIEYGFHVTLIIAGLILAYCFLHLPVPSEK